MPRYAGLSSRKCVLYLTQDCHVDNVRVTPHAWLVVKIRPCNFHIIPFSSILYFVIYIYLHFHIFIRCLTQSSTQSPTQSLTQLELKCKLYGSDTLLRGRLRGQENGW